MFIFGETHFSISNGSFSFFTQEHKRQRTARRSGIILIFRLSVIFHTRFQCFRQRRGKYFSIHRAAGIRFRFLRQSHILFVCRYTAGVHIPNDCNAISFLSTCLNGIYDQENKEAHTPQK